MNLYSSVTRSEVFYREFYINWNGVSLICTDQPFVITEGTPLFVVGGDDFFQGYIHLSMP